MSGLAVFDEVLDPEVLREALENVVKRPGWERLGGRLRKSVSIDHPLSVVTSVPLLRVPWLPWSDVRKREVNFAQDDKVCLKS